MDVIYLLFLQKEREEPGGQLAEGRETAFSPLSLIYHCVTGFRGRDVS